MAELFKVNAPVRKPLFEGVQGENEARSIQFDIEPWVEELGDGAVTATAKRSQDSQPYPVTVTKNGTTVTWKPTSTDTAFAGVGSFQLEYTVDSVLAKTCIWSTMVAPSLDPAGDPPDPYDNWLAEMREIAADAIQAAQDADASADDAQAEVYEAEAWAKGTKNGTPVSSSDAQYQNNAKYWAEQSLANQYGAFIVKSASGDIASFSDGADNVPMKSVNVQIVPKQSGSGDPSPSNVRPITGWTTVNVIVSPTTTASDGTTTPVPLGQTVYGGEVNPISGELEITDVCLTLTGEESGWANAGNTSFYNMSLMVNALAPSGSTKDVKGICSHDATNSSGYLNPYIRKGETYGGLQFYETANYWGISGTDLASKLNYLKAQYTNGTPVQIKYELATPTTVQLTPAQVATLLGTNNVWADCGAVEVEYRADPTLAYAELQALILENI